MRRSFLKLSLLFALIALAPSSMAFAQATPVPSAATPQAASQLPWDWSLQNYKKFAQITVGDVPLTVEIADLPELDTRGLSYRDGLADGTGMLFVYSQSNQRTFWMKGMRFCLDIVWINDGQIVGAAENACPEPGVPDASLTIYPSRQPAQFVLEVPAGFLKAHGYGAGTPVDLSNVDLSTALPG